MNDNNIFIDTNVLIGYWINRKEDVDCLKYLFSLKGKKLYTSALSIAQIVSVFQKKIGNENIKKLIRNIIAKFYIVSFTENDIEKSLLAEAIDIEDNIQYVISCKVKCFHFITNNTKDYNSFLNINVIKPINVRKANW